MYRHTHINRNMLVCHTDIDNGVYIQHSYTHTQHCKCKLKKKKTRTMKNTDTAAVRTVKKAMKRHYIHIYTYAPRERPSQMDTGIY